MRQIEYGYTDGDKYRVGISHKLAEVLRDKLWYELQSKTMGRYPEDLQEVSDIIADLKELEGMMAGHYVNVTNEDLDKLEEELFPPKEPKNERA